jgi:NAD(P)H-dependent flavin oxidoreductase YrpB (nitropropane dioxygenase family)
MITTSICSLLGIRHPVVLGGMGTGTNPALVAAVSNAGGLGIQGCAGRSPAEIAELAAAIRGLTDRPFGLNLLLFLATEEAVAAVLAARPAVVSTAWAGPEYDLDRLFGRVHEAGATVMHMVSTVAEARRAAAAGADVIVAQGTEGGGHVGLMGTIVLVPLVARALAPLPVLADGGATARRLQAGHRGERRPQHGADRDPRHHQRQRLAGRLRACRAQPLHRDVARARGRTTLPPSRGERPHPPGA